MGCKIPESSAASTSSWMDAGGVMEYWWTESMGRLAQSGSLSLKMSDRICAAGALSTLVVILADVIAANSIASNNGKKPLHHKANKIKKQEKACCLPAVTHLKLKSLTAGKSITTIPPPHSSAWKCFVRLKLIQVTSLKLSLSQVQTIKTHKHLRTHIRRLKYTHIRNH